MSSFITRLIPFVFLGVLIVLFVIGLLVLSYLLIFGAFVGLCLFVIVWIKEWISNYRNRHKLQKTTKKRQTLNRTIDHE